MYQQLLHINNQVKLRRKAFKMKALLRIFLAFVAFLIFFADSCLTDSIGQLWFPGGPGSEWTYEDSIFMSKSLVAVDGVKYEQAENGTFISLLFGTGVEFEGFFGGTYKESFGKMNPLTTFRKVETFNNNYKIIGYAKDYMDFISQNLPEGVEAIQFKEEKEWTLYDGTTNREGFSWFVCTLTLFYNDIGKKVWGKDKKILEILGRWIEVAGGFPAIQYEIAGFSKGTEIPLWRFYFGDGGITRIEGEEIRLIELTSFNLTPEPEPQGGDKAVEPNKKTATIWASIKNSK